MIKILRRKFVLITTIMMLVLFGVLWGSNKLYFEYWADRDIYSIVELLANSGVFAEDADVDGEALVEELVSDEPIIGIIVDKDSKILSQQTLGAAGAKTAIQDKTIRKILNDKGKGYKVDGYIYTKQQRSDGSILIVALNAGIHDNSLLRIAMKIVLLGLGVLLLIATTIYLSRFITLPAQEALEREKRFVSDASHELKTPLGAISINAQALELRGDDSIYVKNIISETGRMNRLIERLLTLSKLEESEIKKKEVFSLSDAAEEMVLTYEGVAFEKGRSLHYDIEPDMQLCGNPEEIKQLLVILLDNAIKNSDTNSEIEFTCKKAGKKCQVQVRNNGRGIDQRDIDHIFERFYTTDQSRNNGSFGLGLAIAKEIVTRQGGEIKAESVPGQETVFTVDFA
ncbi:MAG: HAMP domain-containing histidine kinase [Lachnospiraceae bacterium]|nr:HAMP domain-containing histidine kinase [Lachnospiraceae bacterium]